MKGAKRGTVETMLNAPLLRSIEQLLWWLRPALCIMNLMFGSSPVTQSVCCLLKSTEGQTAHHYTTLSVLCTLYFTLLYAVLFSSSSHPDSLFPRGNEGGNHESLLRVWKSLCVRACVRMQVRTYMYFIGGSVIQACGFWNLRSGQRKRSSSLMGSVQGRIPFLCPFSPPLALGEIQQLHHTQSTTP